MAGSSPAPAAGIDWRAFSATYFPDRRRHDLETLVAYSAYKRSGGIDEPSTGRGDSAARNGAEDTASLEAWEDEGGPAM
jgi:hypothetical protein